MIEKIECFGSELQRRFSEKLNFLQKRKVGVVDTRPWKKRRLELRTVQVALERTAQFEVRRRPPWYG